MQFIAAIHLLHTMHVYAIHMVAFKSRPISGSHCSFLVVVVSVLCAHCARYCALFMFCVRARVDAM